MIERLLILTAGPVLRVPIDQLKKRSSAPEPSSKARTLEAADRAHILEAPEGRDGSSAARTARRHAWG